MRYQNFSPSGEGLWQAVHTAGPVGILLTLEKVGSGKYQLTHKAKVLGHFRSLSKANLWLKSPITLKEYLQK